MSSPLAIGAVSAVLRNLLDNGMVNAGAPLSPVKVTAVAPDTIKLDDPSGGPSLNLFLYRVSPNTGWSNAQLPSRNGSGASIANPPLALNLHYLLTAYGGADFQAEILLGYGMHLLHERPVLDRAAIRRALNPSPLGPTILPPAFQALVASDLADQVEAVTLSMEPIDGEEMSRLWSALQSSYRPSAGYVVSVVLIDARKPSHAALPVLERRLATEPGLLAPFPTIERAIPADGQVAALLGESVTLSGHHLDGASLVVHFSHRLLDTPNKVTITANSDAEQVEVVLPSGPAAEQVWPAGVYAVELTLVRPGETNPRTSNVAAMLLAPVPALPPTAVARDTGSGGVTVTLGVSPGVHAAQEARLTLGANSALATPHPTTTASLTFALGDLPPGNFRVRLAVDGVESRLVDRSSEPPTFDPAQSLTVPA
jgi:hypothetical protein